jgi:hypothetical protein
MRGLFSRQIACNVGFNATFRRLQNPDISQTHSLTKPCLFKYTIVIRLPRLDGRLTDPF